MRRSRRQESLQGLSIASPSVHAHLRGLQTLPAPPLSLCLLSSRSYIRRDTMSPIKIFNPWPKAFPMQSHAPAPATMPHSSLSWCPRHPAFLGDMGISKEGLFRMCAWN